MASRQISRALVDSNILSYTDLVNPKRTIRGDARPWRPIKYRKAMKDAALAKETVKRGREAIRDVLRGNDDRILLIDGPCSTRDEDEHRDFAARTKALADELSDTFVLVQRVYFEKPRTTVGWKGLINEPHLDGKENINDGLRLARQLLMHNAVMGLPSATEFLDPVVPQYIGDLISWAAIGARTVESPVHRQMASGLSMPVGFKNSTEGNVQVAVNAVIAAGQPQWFFGQDARGRSSGVTTRGNDFAHVVLRGSETGTNYDAESVRAAQAMLRQQGLSERLIVDCSHGNSSKDFMRQPIVFEDLIRQIVDGNKGIAGVMLESNINEGRQNANGDPSKLKYGVSITDGCISWETTEAIFRDAAKMLARR